MFQLVWVMYIRLSIISHIKDLISSIVLFMFLLPHLEKYEAVSFRFQHFK